MSGGFVFRLAMLACAWVSATITPGWSQSEPAKDAPAPIFDVRKFGAAGDGTTLDTVAIQKAIDAASAAGGGTVLLPPGSYLSATIRLKSHVVLKVDKGATLLGSTDAKDYSRLGDFPGGPTAKDSPKFGFFLGLILADQQEGIGICGGGVIDGQGKLLVAGIKTTIGPGKRPYAGEGERPTIIGFERCRNVTVRDITLREGACWVQHYRDCDDVRIEGVTVRTMATITNDGLDLDGCSRVVVRNCDIDSEDDAICLKSTTRACTDVLIENCRARSTTNALKFGTASHVGFKNITIRNLEIWDTYMSGIALELVDGGVMENVTISNVRISECANPLFIRLGHRNTEGQVGAINNVVISDVTANMPLRDPATMNKFPPNWRHKCRSLVTASITGLPDHPVRGITLRNVTFTYEGAGKTKEDDMKRFATPAGVPECAEHYPEAHMFGILPAWAMYCRHAAGIRFEKVAFVRKQADDRPALSFDDVKNLLLQRVTVQPAGSAPTAIFHQVEGLEIKDSTLDASAIRHIDAQGNPVEAKTP